MGLGAPAKNTDLGNFNDNKLSTGGKWKQLQDVIVHHIFQQLGWCQTTSSSFRLVCKGWNAAHDVVLPLLRPSKLSVDNTAIQKSFPNVERISLELCYDSISSSSLQSFSGLLKLTSLHISGEFFDDKVGDDFFLPIQTLSSLTSLDFSHYKSHFICGQVMIRATHNFIRPLVSLSRLTHLDLENLDIIDDTGLKMLCDLKGLTSLGLAGLDRITDDGFKSLCSSLHSLTDLNLYYCKKIPNPGLCVLSSLSNLTSLDISGYFRTLRNGVFEINSLSKLTKLIVNQCDISHRFLSKLKEMDSLVSLDMKNCEFEDVSYEAWKTLGSMSNLTHLGLWRWEISEVHNADFDPTINPLSFLTGLTNLTSLDLNDSRTTADLTPLTSMVLLKELHLCMCDINDSSLAPLANLPHLSALDVSSCFGLTEKSLMYFSRMSSLKTLNFQEARTILGDYCASRLSSVIPSLTVLEIGNWMARTLKNSGLSSKYAFPPDSPFYSAKCATFH